MAKNPSGKAVLALGLELDQRDLSTLTEAFKADGNPTETIKTCVENYLHEYANGGFVLTAEDVATMGKTLGKKVGDSKDIITALEDSAGNKKGSKVFKLEVDPALIGSFEDAAKMRGVTVEDYVTECWNYIHANGWMFNMNPDVAWVPFGGQDAEYLKSSTGSPVLTSTGVVNLLKKRTVGA